MAATGVSDASELQHDDAVIVFQTEKSRVRGRLVRLGQSATAVLSQHEIPGGAKQALGQALALSTMLAASLPGQGRIIVQTRSDGAVPFTVADCSGAGHLRGYARFDAAKADAAQASPSGRILGDGHLSITLDSGGEEEAYQGIMALDGGSLAACASAYFSQREDTATTIFLAAALGKQDDALWRAGGLMLQNTASGPDAHEDWVRVSTLAGTLSDEELTDPTLAPDRLLFNLFREDGVRVLRQLTVAAQCRCSRARIEQTLGGFGASELASLADERGRISAKCEFCSTVYEFEASTLGSI